MPEKLRYRALELAHEEHPGMTKIKQKVHAKMWWPKIDADVEKVGKKCQRCTMTSAPPPPEPMKRIELPSEPWQNIGINLMETWRMQC